MNLTVRPVLDLNQHRAGSGYAIPDLLREQVILRNPTCVFPFCSRPARGCDLDHVIAYADGGTTTSDNLAPLCRRHHRAKTHGHWTYIVVAPGRFRWTGPHGQTWVTDPTGTRDTDSSDPAA